MQRSEELLSSKHRLAWGSLLPSVISWEQQPQGCMPSTNVVMDFRGQILGPCLSYSPVLGDLWFSWILQSTMGTRRVHCPTRLGAVPS